MIKRPTEIRRAFENAMVLPGTNRETVRLVVRSTNAGGGYIHHRPKTLVADGPRPAGAPPVTKTIFPRTKD